MILLIFGIYKTKQMNKRDKTETVIDTENRWLPEGRVEGLSETSMGDEDTLSVTK